MSAFESQQEQLRNRVSRGEAKYIFLDPDGTLPSWIGVVIETQSGGVYATQCAGTSNDLRLVEGYFILLGGPKMSEDGYINTGDLTAPFHQGQACLYGGAVGELPSDRLGQLRRAVANIPCWATCLHGQNRKVPLEIDDTRLRELCEAWVPVVTANGRGVLLWSNCD